ncbi:hypothetical protein PoB_001037600 [Plakobranchus ocellatus]|uniref:Uncharacterized protein n=1 Tax=Plakobranchus ocellatus TaxID=259542 RepID=A0AAV3Y9D8_9GAST|nr:hypothetical protein PoB_001037600 [Plakobranchus ocellatus]
MSKRITPFASRYCSTLGRLKEAIRIVVHQTSFKSHYPWLCLDKEIVEKLSGTTQTQRIKVRRDEEEIQIDTVVLTSDSPNPPTRIRA